MIPSIDFTLAACSDLLTKIAPTMSTNYLTADTQMVALMISTASQCWDGVVHELVNENRALRALFAKILPHIEEKRLAIAIKDLIASSDDDLRISALTEENSKMRSALIEAHATIELIDSDGARSVERAIWSELVKATERRHTQMDSFY